MQQIHNQQRNNIPSFSKSNISIQIQYCSNCDAHLFLAKHLEKKYQQFYKKAKKIFQKHKIIVTRRQIPKNLIKKSPYCPQNIYYCAQTKENVFFPRVGSFEIYLNKQILFSRLQSGTWPVLQQILVSVLKRVIEFKVKQKNKLYKKIDDEKLNRQNKQSVKKQQNKHIIERQKSYRIYKHVTQRNSIQKQSTATSRIFTKNKQKKKVDKHKSIDQDIVQYRQFDNNQFIDTSAIYRLQLIHRNRMAKTSNLQKRYSNNNKTLQVKQHRISPYQQHHNLKMKYFKKQKDKIQRKISLFKRKLIKQTNQIKQRGISIDLIKQISEENNPVDQNSLSSRQYHQK